VVVGACRPSTAPTTTPVASNTTPPSPAPETEPRPQPVDVQSTGAADRPANDPEPCNPYIAPRERKAGGLTVHAPPDPDRRSFPGRIRNHVDGGLSHDSTRLWIGPQVPGFMPLVDGTKELFLLEHEGDVFVGLYRDPYGASSCDLSTPRNCDYSVQAFNACGDALWAFAIGPLMSRGDQLEVGDLRYADGVLYFNEGCQTFARDANGKCSALVAFDPTKGEVVWRTKNLISRGPFVVRGQYIVAGYGFTHEKDFLYIVRRSDGKVVGKHSLKRAHETLVIEGDTLVVTTNSDTHQFTMSGFDGPKPKLTPAR